MRSNIRGKVRRAALQPALLPRQAIGLDAVRYTQLADDLGQIVAHGAVAEAEALRDVAGGYALAGKARQTVKRSLSARLPEVAQSRARSNPGARFVTRASGQRGCVTKGVDVRNSPGICLAYVKLDYSGLR